MCGIAGFIGSDPRLNEALLLRMRDAQRHRGPDDAGSVVLRSSFVVPRSSTKHEEPSTKNVTIGLAHNRLSIIDLSPAGHQPMANEDESVWIVFNGEFYNFQEYLEELKDKGHVFKSHTDTEVIIHLYEEYGMDETLRRMNGMFAFALWDERRGELHLARDRVGKKPLYYWIGDGGEEGMGAGFQGFRGSGGEGDRVQRSQGVMGAGVQGVSEWTAGDDPTSVFRCPLSPASSLAFASEIPALLASGLVDASALDLQAFDEFWTLGYTVGERSIYQGVRRLPAGCRAVWKNGQLSITRYWDVQFGSRIRTNRSGEPSLDDYVDELMPLLEDAVRLRLLADVPVGICLSGGIDSAVIALMVSRIRSDVPAFTIAFDNTPEDESVHAAAVARHLGLDHRVLNVSPDLADEFPKIAAWYGEPFGDPSSIPMYFLSKLIREHATVALTGDGGDELFAGYDHYREALRLGESSWFFVLRSSLQEGTWPAKFKRFASDVFYRSLDPELAHALRGRRVNDRLARKIYTKATRKAINRRATIQARAHIVEEPRTKNDEHCVLEILQNADFHTYMTDDVLTKVDRMSMAHGLECRSPFMDYRIIEWAARLPARVKMGEDGQGKLILRHLLSRHLPTELYDRPKQGFTPPWERWCQGVLRSRLRADWKGLELPLVRPEGLDSLVPAEGPVNPVLSWLAYAYVMWRRQR